MNDNERQFENFVHGIEFDDIQDPKHRDKLEKNLLAALARQSRQKPRIIKIWRIIMKSRTTKLATAVAVIIAAVTGIHYLSDSTNGEKIINKTLVPGDEAIVVQRTNVLEAELRGIKQMFASGDIKGLIDMLDKGRWETKVAAANYLAKIGDSSVIGTLQNLGERWNGDSSDNPFVTAVTEIKNRLEREKNEQQVRQEQEPEIQIISPGSQPETTVVKTITKDSQVTITFRGVVKNEVGKPIEGAMVRSDVSYYKPPKFVIGETYNYTNMQGLFQIGPLPRIIREEGSRILVFEHPDYAIGLFSPNSNREVDPNSLTITMFEPSVVVGRVVDSKGDPVQDALVQTQIQLLIDKSYDYYSFTERNHLAVTTDADGYFYIEKVPKTARFHIFITKKGYVNYSTRDIYPGDIYLIRAGQDDLVFVLEPGFSIYGRLVYNGVAYNKDGIMVIALDENNRSGGLTDENGRFEIYGLREGIYKLMVESDYLSDVGLSCSILTDVEVGLGQPAPNIDLVLQKGLPVSIRVIDESTSEPVCNIWVSAILPDKESAIIASGQTDENGKCTIRVTPGDYLLSAPGWKNASFHQYTKDFSVKPDSNDLNVEIAIHPRTVIRGWLVDPNEKPIRGTVLFGGESTDTNEHGGFTVDEPWFTPGETYIVYALDTTKKLGLGFFWERKDEINDSEIFLLPVANIAGRIVDPNGQGVEDLQPELGINLPNDMTRYSSRNPWKTKVETDGRFLIECVPVGLPMKISVDKPGYYGGFDLPELKSGQVLEIADIVLKPKRGFEDGQTDWTGTLSGLVINENMEPMSNLRVWADGAKGISDDTTDINGRYKLINLPRGKSVSGGVYADGYGHNTFKKVVDGNEFDIQIFPQAWELLDEAAPGLFVEKWLNTEPLTLEQFHGKVVLLQIGILLPNYLQNIGQIQNTTSKYGDKGLQVIAVHEPLSVTWAGKVTEQDIKEFIEENNIKFPFGISVSTNQSMRTMYDSRVTPSLYLIDKKGILRISPKRNDLDKWIEKLIAE